MMHFTFVYTAAFFAAVSAQIQWNGLPFAISSAPNITRGQQTILRATSQPKSTQFTYTKIPNEAAFGALVSVRLQNLRDPSFDLELMSQFDMLTQQCSCYWIDFADLNTKAQQKGITIKSDLSYQIVFREANVAYYPREWASGLFGLTTSNKTTGLPEPMTNLVIQKDKERRELLASKVIVVPDPRVVLKDGNQPYNYTDGLNIRSDAATLPNAFEHVTTITALFILTLLIEIF